MADSLLGAIKGYWADEGLPATLGKLFAEGLPQAAPALPFVVIDDIDETAKGPMPETNRVDLYLTVYAAGPYAARTIAREIRERFGDIEDPAPPDRDRFAWETGSEQFCESDDATAKLSPRLYAGKQAYAYRLHYIFWITGTP